MERTWHLQGVLEQLLIPLLKPDPPLGFRLCGVIHFLTVEAHLNFSLLFEARSSLTETDWLTVSILPGVGTYKVSRMYFVSPVKLLGNNPHLLLRNPSQSV